MSMIRNFDKLLSASIFKKPNGYLFPATHRQIFLCTESQPHIDFTHSSKALLQTIDLLNRQKQSTTYKFQIITELANLQKHKESYSKLVKQYVERGGYLTAQGIANIYYSAEKLNLSADWLNEFVHPQVSAKAKHMSRANLHDLITGLKKSKPDCHHIKALEDLLASKKEGQHSYAQYILSSTSEFEGVENSVSANVLINSASLNKPLWKYYIDKFVEKCLCRKKYVLHSV